MTLCSISNGFVFFDVYVPQPTSLRGSAAAEVNWRLHPYGFRPVATEAELRVEKALRAKKVDNPCLRVVTFWPRNACPFESHGEQTLSREDAIAHLNRIAAGLGWSPMPETASFESVSCVPGTVPGTNTASELCVHFGSITDVTPSAFMCSVDHAVEYGTVECTLPLKPRHPETNPMGCWMGLDWYGDTPSHSGLDRPSSASLSHSDFDHCADIPWDALGRSAANHVGAKILATDYEKRGVALKALGCATSVLRSALRDQEVSQGHATILSAAAPRHES